MEVAQFRPSVRDIPCLAQVPSNGITIRSTIIFHDALSSFVAHIAKLFVHTNSIHT